ncbi:hypothetical protein [Sorangium atrum]|uniref:Uncharacterized protein n=1 Tax=Sorangium atrum TaxID=2995308 RepID=A0ABT5CH86_9BACT|nr:hypothetical protein [Sorangium aterium]MDC0685801.1 hypothetical protein [Sorangium aterium]
MSFIPQQGNFLRMRSRLYLVDDVARGAADNQVRDEVLARLVELNRVRTEDERTRGWRWYETRANWTTMATTEAGALRARGSSRPLLTREHDA